MMSSVQQIQINFYTWLYYNCLIIQDSFKKTEKSESNSNRLLLDWAQMYSFTLIHMFRQDEIYYLLHICTGKNSIFDYCMFLAFI